MGISSIFFDILCYFGIYIKWMVMFQCILSSVQRLHCCTVSVLCKTSEMHIAHSWDSKQALANVVYIFCMHVLYIFSSHVFFDIRTFLPAFWQLLRDMMSPLEPLVFSTRLWVLLAGRVFSFNNFGKLLFVCITWKLWWGFSAVDTGPFKP